VHIAFHRNSYQSYGASPAIRDQAVLSSTRHSWMR